MKKQILQRGYITYALTDGDKKIYGFTKEHSINFELALDKKYYWSEVYCEPGYMVTIIRKGKLLVNTTSEKLKKYFEQTKVNLHE